MKSLIKRWFVAGLLAALLAACAPAKAPVSDPGGAQIENPYAAQPGDGTMVRDSVEIVKTEIATLKSNPPQFALKVDFFTPTPCHQFRVSVDKPGADGRINVEVYSLMTPGKVCTLMRLSTPTEATLNLAGLAAGHHTVWVNGVKALEFDA